MARALKGRLEVPMFIRANFCDVIVRGSCPARPGPLKGRSGRGLAGDALPHACACHICEPVAAEMYPPGWEEQEGDAHAKLVDMYLATTKLIDEHDRPSHFHVIKREGPAELDKTGPQHRVLIGCPI